MYVEIERAHENGLVRRVWRFYISTRHGLGLEARLDRWACEERPSRRHKFRPSTMFARHRYQVQEASIYTKVLKEEPPVPEDVTAEVRRVLADGLTFVKNS